MVEGARRATGTIPPPEAVTTTTHDMTNEHPSGTPESGPKKRRFLSAEKKFQIYLEAQSTDKPVGELLRREAEERSWDPATTASRTDSQRTPRRRREGRDGALG